MKAYWNVKEFAEYIGKSEQLVYKWVRERKIPYHKPNGVLMFHIEQTTRFLDSKQVKPKAA